MNKTLLIVFFIAVAIFIGFSILSMQKNNAEKEVRTVSSSDIQVRDITVDTERWLEIAKNFQPSQNLVFDVREPPIAHRESITLKGVLSNTSPLEERIIVLPIGDKGFHIELIDAEHITYVGSKEAPVPPPASELVIPGNTAVEFTGIIDLNDYEFSKRSGIDIRWKFSFWNNPQPEGVSSINLFSKI